MNNLSISTKFAACLLIGGGIGFVIQVITSAIIVLPRDIFLNVVICIGSGIAIKMYKDQGDNTTKKVYAILFITEAAWIAFPIIILLPVSLLVFAIHRSKSVHDNPTHVVEAILAFVATGLTIPFLFVMDVIFSNWAGMDVISLSYDSLRVAWSLYFIGRDIIPGILLLLDEEMFVTAASEPVYKAPCSVARDDREQDEMERQGESVESEPNHKAESGEIEPCLLNWESDDASKASIMAQLPDSKSIIYTDLAELLRIKMTCDIRYLDRLLSTLSSEGKISMVSQDGITFIQKK